MPPRPQSFRERVPALLGGGSAKLPRLPWAHAPGKGAAGLHSTEFTEGPLASETADTALTAAELRDAAGFRRLGATGTVLMAFGAVGAGAQPVLQNPAQGTRLLGLMGRMPSVSLSVTLLGMVAVVVAWLALGRFAFGLPVAGPRRHLTRGQLDSTLWLWVLPLLLAPPMFSKDVYSYLAQSEIAARGLNPYEIGPGPALGVDHVLARTVPTIWRDTPAPYGPLFLMLGRGIGAITGDAIVPGIFLHRAVAVAGIGLCIWALPRLAARCGVSPVIAIWLGAMNPLVLFHLIAGVHNEALMLGLMLLGLEIALRGIDRFGTPEGHRNHAWPLLLGGMVILCLATAIKAPALLSLGFVGMALAHRWGGGFRRILAAAMLALAVSGSTFLIIGLASGWGLDWTRTLGTNGAIRSWMSLPTILGVAAGAMGEALELGDHTTAALALLRPVGLLVTAGIVLRMLLATGAGRIHPLGGLGMALAGTVVFSAVVHPWYLVWCIVPLAAWANRPAFRVPAIVVSAIIPLVVMPNGAEFRPFLIAQGIAAGLIVAAIAIALLQRSFGWPLVGTLGISWPRWLAAGAAGKPKARAGTKSE